MRPLRLEISGFTTFRDPVEIELADASYFALVGPTGSGKSSVIDALTFALYGSVPRLDQKSVAPIITQGKQEARVRLDFAIGDATYTAVRVVRRQAGGASTKEARLECGDTVLAGDADGVTTEVERLLGLSFDQFTRCVVLPQGEFARFLHDKPAARQDLLVRLLGLDMYERMAQRANQRAAAADGQLVLQRERLDKDLGFATDDALRDARAQVERLSALMQRIGDEEPTLEALRETVRSARADEQAATRAATALERITVPADIDRVASAAADARVLARTAGEQLDAAETALESADAAVAGLPDRAVLERATRAHQQLDALAKQRAATDRELAAADAALDAAVEAAAAAETAAHEAQHALERARIELASADLARTLAAGEPCPVCKQTVATLPAIETPEDLARAEQAVSTALARQRDAGAKASRVERDRAVLRARAADIDTQTAAVRQDTDAYPDASAVRARLAEIGAAEKAREDARAAAKAARGRVTQARELLDALAAQTAEARKTLDAARDAVAELAPPPLGHEDLAADWRALAGWAAEHAPVKHAGAAEARERAAKAEADGTAVVDAQRRACADAGIADVQVPRDDCMKALERAKDSAERIEDAIEAAKILRTDVAALEERATVARALGGHLKANAFERWVLRQALTTLVDGATQMLNELSGGQYSLSLDKNFNFSVIDHRNANTERSARTLSGGETFLASLALALALSDRIAQLSANTAVRLESIFLDEGFGTLDDETLEVVATALETLSASNRVVGIVTHVRGLAERVPVRFEVRKGPVTSEIEKVLA